MPHAVRPHDVKQRQRAGDIVGVVLRRILDRLANFHMRGEMHYRAEIRRAEQIVQQFAVVHFAAHEFPAGHGVAPAG